MSYGGGDPFGQLVEKVVDDVIFQYRNPPEGDSYDVVGHREQCVQTLGKLGHPKAVPIIIECLEDKQRHGLYTAAWDALWHVSDEALIPVIDAEMDVKALWCARPAARCLGRLGRPAIPLLERILDAPDPLVQQAAIHALAEICLPECLAPLERLADSRKVQNSSAKRKLGAAIATIR